jgi:hypothetical protein
MKNSPSRSMSAEVVCRASCRSTVARCRPSQRRTRRLSRSRREGETTVADGPRMTVADVVADR